MSKNVESTSILLSAFYAKFIIILGAALPVTNAIIGASPRKIDAFYIYLNITSTIFLMYAYIMYMIEKKTIHKNDRKTFLNDNSQIRHGSFYLHLGVATFGMISVIYSSLQFGQYFELTSKCNDPLMAILPLTKVVFMVQQMIFIFSWSQQIKKNKHVALRRFGIMHMISTNICAWIRVIIEETKFDIFNATQNKIMAETLSNKKNSTLDENSSEGIEIKKNLTQDVYKFSWEYDSNSPDCYSSNIMKPLLRNANPYLSPCAVEYSLLCTVILVIMWKNICSNIKTNEDNEDKSVVEKQKQVVVDYNEPLNKFYFDCSNAQKGLFLAITLFSGTIISLIMFFELVKSPQYLEVAVFQVNVWEITLFSSSTIVSIVCMIMIRKVAHHEIKKDFHSEHVLLFVTQSGVYLYSMFQMIGYYFLIIENTAESKILRILTPTFSIIQSTIQTLLIIETWRRNCNSSIHIKQKSARQILTFLIISNISLWIINRVKNNRAEFHPLQMEFYGVWAWTIITHIALPMVVCYRFQSTICFYQIWKNMNEESEIEKKIIKSIRIRK